MVQQCDGRAPGCRSRLAIPTPDPSPTHTLACCLGLARYSSPTARAHLESCLATFGAAAPPSQARWTLKYQAEVLTRDVDVAIANAHISAITLWHFFDFKVDDRQENGTACEYESGVFPPTCAYIRIDGRPGGVNHKGVVDFWRRPKPAFALVAARYNATRRSPQAAPQ